MQPELIGGRYRVVRAIGKGGMGTVWLCRDETLNREVAVKQVGLLPGESVPDSARALREARSSAALGHRNVVTVFDVVEDAGAVWMVMEHVPSRTLSELIRDEGRLDPVRVAAIGAQVADGLAAAHAAGTTHRDVKPGNIFVREDGVTKIGDFGIARNAADPALTQSGLFTGTPNYFSPELATGADPEPASDVWALGASLYAAVEGRPPYEPRSNPMASLHEVSQTSPPRPAHAGVLEPVLLRMLDRDPATRWSMVDVAHRLHRLVDEQQPGTREATAAFPAVAAAAGAAGGGAATTEPDTGPTPMGAAGASGRPGDPAGSGDPTGPPPPRRRRPGAVALAALALLLLLGGLAAYVAMDQGNEEATAADQATAASSSASHPERSPSPKPEPSSRKPEPSSPAPEPSSSPEPKPSSPEAETSPAAPETTAKPTPPAPAGAGDPVSFVQTYYATAPDDTDAGWQMLGPDLQAQGKGSYERFWGSLDSATPSDITPVAGSDDVEVTLRYVFDNGEVSVERQRLDLVPDGNGGWLINEDTPIG